MVLSACAGAPFGPGPSTAFIGESDTAAEYADFLTARYAGLTQDPAAAAHYYGRAWERSPEDGAMLERAVFATLVDGDVPAAAHLAASAKPGVMAASSFARLTLIAEDIAGKRYGRALKRLDAGNLGALNEDIARGLAAWLTAKQNVDKGVARTDLGAGHDSPLVQPDYLRALILSSAGRDADALKAFEAGGASGGATPLLVAAHVRLAAATGDKAGAQKILNAAMDANGAAPELEQASDMLAGRTPLTPVRLSTQEGAATAILMASSGSLATSNPELAAAWLALSLYIDPDLDAARMKLVEALRSEDRPDDAIARLCEVKAGSLYFAEARIEEARLQQSAGRGDAALAAAQAAVAASRQRNILLGAADIYRAENRNADAEAIYTDVVNADAASHREDWRPLFARAAVREQLGRWPEAEADLRLALSYAPNQPQVLNFLGYAWVDRGENVEEGFRLIQRALRAQPNQGYIIDSLGWAHYRRGEYGDAVTALEKAVELEPADSVITDHLGDAYWRAGRRTEASFEWNRALQLKPDAKQTAELRGKLAHGLPELALRDDRDRKASQ